MDLRGEICSGQGETGWQWKVPCQSVPIVLVSPTHSLYGWLMGKEGWWAWGVRVRTRALL